MKLLKVTLENLASYDGAYTIDFTKEPLKSTGLYSIVGATGSGKSTILDAICLALYGTAPRFKGASKMNYFDNQDIHSREKDKVLKPEDPRNILRKGAKEGRAEVEFIANDGERYRAIWYSKRGTKLYGAKERILIRYRKNSDGTETEEILCKQNKESAIFQDIIGLDYEQFTRTIMLAQNSFANFIRCDAKEKAKLLERLTGTEIYTRIAVRIKTHYDEAKKRLETFQAVINSEARNRLQDEEVTACRKQLTGIKEQICQQEEAVKTTERHIEWIHQMEAVQQAFRATQTELQQKQLEWATYAEDTKHLSAFDTLNRLSGTYAQFQQVEKDISKDQLDTKEAEQALQQAQEEEKTWRQKSETICRQLKHTQDDYEKLQPRLIAARNVLSVMMVKKKEYKSLNVKRDEAKKKAEAASRSVRENEAKQQQAQQILTTSGNTLKELHRFEKPLLKADVLLKLLGDLKHLDIRLTENKVTLQRLRTEAERLLKEEKGLQMKSEQLKQKADGFHKQLTTLEKQLKQQDIATLRMTIEKGQTTVAQFKEACDNWKTYFAAVRLCYKLRGSIAEKKKIIQSLQKEEQKLTKSRQEIETQLPGLQTAYQMFVSKSVETMRSVLKDNTPCPVCGALHHPYAERQAADSAAAALQQELETLQKNKNATEQRLNEVQKQLSRETGDMAGLMRNLTIEQDSFPEKESNWKQMVHLDISLETDIPEDDRDSGVKRYIFLDTRRKQAETLLKKQQEAEKAYLKTDKDYKELLLQRDELLKRIQETDTLYNGAKLKATQKAQEADIQAQHMAESEAQRQKSIEELNGYGLENDWLSLWQQGADTYIKRWQQRSETWKRATQIQEETGSELKSLKAAGHSLKTQEEDARLHFGQMDKEASSAREELTTLQLQIDGFWGGILPDAVEKAAKEKLEEQRRMNETATEKVNLSKSTVEIRTATLTAKRQQLKTDQQRQDTLRTGIEEGLKKQENKVSFEQLEWFFAPERNWEGIRSHLNHLKEQLKELEGIMKTRLQQVREKKEDKNHTDQSEGTLQIALEQQRNELEQRQQQQQELLLKLENDRKSRQRLLKYAKEEEQLKTAAGNWGELNKLMGANQGDDIRQAAQCYTLQFLIAHANSQLKMLTSRYRLVQVPDSLSLRVKDMDYAGEERNISSLSGGETFLISLALALGLSAISSGNHNYGMLFIDEGFGTLDQESLNIVIDALSMLQSVQGKKVCVISHTAEMRERIPVQIQVIKGKAEGKSSLRIA